jgi:hypothetical protein
VLGNDSRSGGASHGRSLRILFVVQEATLLRFALLIPALARRGHHVHIAFASGKSWQMSRPAEPVEPPARALRLAEEFRTAFPAQVTHGLAPERAQSDPWQPLIWMVRALADLAHTAHPRYANTFTRRRTKKRLARRLQQRSGQLEPLGRRLALRAAKRAASETDAGLSRSMRRLTTRLEDAIPTSGEIDRFVRELAPDILLTTGTFRHLSSEVEFLKTARKLRVPSGIFVASWDNLTNKGALKFQPERVFLWNEAQAEEAVELHGIPRERVRATGAHVFDEWFERRPSRSREEFAAQLGLDPAEPYLIYLCSSGNVAKPGEVEFVRGWIESLRASGDERLRRINVVVRPHPNASLQWREAKLELENVVVWPPQGVHPVAAQARDDFFDSIAYSAAVVGINTTAMIEAAILGKSVLTVLVPEFNQQSTLHFQYLLAENGGFLHVAASLDDHVDQVRHVLDEDAAGAERRRRFVESFVRPGGIDRPAAPIAAAAIEELARVPVQSSGLRARLLRVPLMLEVGLSAAYRSFRGLRGRKERARSIELEPRERPS